MVLSLSRQLSNLISEAVQRIATYRPKALVVACNTATSAAIESLRDKYSFPIIGMEPAIKPALSQYDPRKVLVFATTRTLKEQKYQSLISDLDAKDRVDGFPMDRLVDFAEEFDFDSFALKQYIKSQSLKINWNDYHTLVLGCTHYIYYKKIIKSIIPSNINIVDGNHGTIMRLKALVGRKDRTHTNTLQVILSGQEVAQEVIAPYLKILNCKV